MRINDLKFVNNAPYYYDSDREQQFIFLYGLLHCKKLKCKDGDSILSEMQKAYPDEEFSVEQVNFMHEISDKEVLVRICDQYDNKLDIFVFPENNTPFTVECFI